MPKLTQEDIHIITKHSNWSEKGLRQALQQDVYSSADAWKKFLQILFIVLGVGFAVAGLIFFFAYNWSGLHRLVKLGLVEGLLVLATIVAVLPKLSPLVKNTVLTGAAVLVGLLFTLFGQIYQSDADAYFLFLWWIIAITVWAFIANFPPLWLVYLFLVNINLILFEAQIASDWSMLCINLLLLNFNATCLLLAILVAYFKMPRWFLQVLLLPVLFFATVCVAISLNEDEDANIVERIAAYVLPAIYYTLGIRYAFQTKNIVFLALIPASVIAMISALFLRFVRYDSNPAGIFLLVSVFVIVSITVLIVNVVKIQKKWLAEPIKSV